jgi:hypothetical protein
MRTICCLLAAGLLAAIPAGLLEAQGNVPRIQTLVPSSALIGGNSNITVVVNGSNFRDGADVRWNNLPRQTTFISTSQLQVTILAADLATAGTADITVHVPPNRVSAPATFTINNPPPNLASISPTTAQAGGQSVTLTVTGTSLVQGAQILWKGQPRSTTRVSATQLRTTLSTADIATPGNAEVAVRNPAPGGGDSPPRTLSITHQTPAITGFVPERVVQGSGAFTLTVRGSSFIATTSTVLWNGAPRETRYVSPTELRADITASDLASPGTAPVSVRTVTGGSTRTSPAVNFIIELAPQPVGVVVVTTAPPAAPVINAFHVGGAANPERVFAGTPAELFTRRSGGSPTHWRVAPTARGIHAATWQAMSTPQRYTFPSTATGERTLYFQLANVAGRDTAFSSIVNDPVIVRPTWSTAGVTTSVAGSTAGTRHRLVCPTGQIMTGMTMRLGMWIDALAPICTSRTLGLVGNTTGGRAVTATCGAGEVPSPTMVVKHSSIDPLVGTFVSSVLVPCGPSPAALGARQTYDPLFFTPTGGAAHSGPYYRVECRDGGFPIGADIYVTRLVSIGQEGIAGVGFICAAPD